MNDQDWMKKFRRHRGGGCTLAPAVALALLAALAWS